MGIKIQFATDFVCPYCFAARFPLQQALSGRDDVEVELLPLELTPTDRAPVDTWNDDARRTKWSKDLVPFCETLGINAHFPPHVVPRPYTHLAWQGYHYACTKGKGLDYADAMYHAYFVSEQDIGSLDVLCAVAGSLGLDVPEFRATLEVGTYSAFQNEAVTRTRQMGVKAVPTIWIGNLRLAGDLYTKEDFELYLSLAAGGDSGSYSGGFGCGPDGC